MVRIRFIQCYINMQQCEKKRKCFIFHRKVIFRIICSSPLRKNQPLHVGRYNELRYEAIQVSPRGQIINIFFFPSTHSEIKHVFFLFNIIFYSVRKVRKYRKEYYYATSEETTSTRLYIYINKNTSFDGQTIMLLISSNQMGNLENIIMIIILYYKSKSSRVSEHRVQH